MWPIKFQTCIDRLDKLKLNYIEIPVNIVKEMGGTFKMRLMCSVNGAEPFHGGLVALGEGKGYITLNNKRMKELGLSIGDWVEVVLNPDESKYGMPVPEELAELLRQDPEGERRFEMLTPGKQRYIIHYVSQVKSSQLRIDRAMLLIGNLKKLPEGNEDFRGMLGLD
jgi:hypothetical protein